MLVIPTDGIEAWKRRLADPENHWRVGFSAHSLAVRWEASSGFPPEVMALFAQAPELAGLEMLRGIPEHKVALPGGSRASQTDLWVLGRSADDLVSIAIEAKVRESFGPTLKEWFLEETPGKSARWAALCDVLGFSPDCDRSLRYQLVHRAASAVLEAKRFLAGKAVLVVHSFSSANDGFSDFQAFARQFGATIDAPGELRSAGRVGGVDLFIGWAHGPQPNACA